MLKDTDIQVTFDKTCMCSPVPPYDEFVQLTRGTLLCFLIFKEIQILSRFNSCMLVITATTSSVPF